MLIRRFTQGLALVTVVCFSLSAWSQGQDSQLRYNAKAVEAMHEGDYPRALQLLRSSLALGGLNMTWLNLGRALQKLDHCEDAYAAYEQVADAEPVEAPSPDEVAKVMARWRAELDELCTAEVVIVCKDEGTLIAVDGGEPRPCDGSPIRVPAGERSVVAKRGDGELTDTFSANAGERASLELAAITEGSDGGGGDGGGDVPPRGEGVSDLAIAGWIVSGAGATALIAALVLDLAVVGPSLDEFRDAAATDAERARDLKGTLETEQTITIAVGAVGAGILAAGVVMVLVDAMSDDDAERGTGTAVWVDERGAGVVWTVTW